MANGTNGYDITLATQVCSWLNRIAKRRGHAPVEFGDFSEDSVHETLKDGVHLMRVLHAIDPWKAQKINESKMAFKQKENIEWFLSGAEALGVSKNDLFQTSDLYEKQNMTSVINGLAVFANAHELIPKLAADQAPSGQTREFFDSQSREEEGAIGLQKGSNKCANQSGQNFGKTRAILD